MRQFDAPFNAANIHFMLAIKGCEHRPGGKPRTRAAGRARRWFEFLTVPLQPGRTAAAKAYVPAYARAKRSGPYRGGAVSGRVGTGGTGRSLKLAHSS